MRNRMLAILLAGVLLAALPLASHAARGGHHGGGRRAELAVCTIADCIEAGVHVHDGQAVLAHFYGDGHDYHAYCPVEDCPQDGYHCHDGVYCFGVVADGWSDDLAPRGGRRGCCG